MKYFKGTFLFSLLILPLVLDHFNQAALGIFISAILLWMSELLPLPVTALLIPVYATSTGVLTSDQAFSQFGNQILFLFLGSFLLAHAMEKHRLDQRMSYWILSTPIAAKGPEYTITLISILAWVLSMWISNTAATAMMIPLCLGISRTLAKDWPSIDKGHLEKRLLFSSAFGASIGGMATPVGSPPNLLAMEFLKAKGIDISFMKWVLFGVPLSFVMLILLLVLLKIKFPIQKRDMKGIDLIFKQQLQNMGKTTKAEILVMITFFITVMLWILPDFLKLLSITSTLSKSIPMGAVALIGASLLFIFKDGANTILNWEDSKHVDWGTVLIFGGGLCLGKILDVSGLGSNLGQSVFGHFDSIIILGILCTILGVVVSEFSSNTAATTLLVPIILGKFGDSSFATALVVATAFGASFGFMLPVSTPPNAIIYGTGKIQLKEMMSTGIIFDILGALLVVLFVVLLYPFLGLF